MAFIGIDERESETRHSMRTCLISKATRGIAALAYISLRLHACRLPGRADDVVLTGSQSCANGQLPAYVGNIGRACWAAGYAGPAGG